jgi:hypothetical protein
MRKSKKRKRKHKITQRLDPLQVRDMMENKLRASTIASGKIYKRKKVTDYGDV